VTIVTRLHRLDVTRLAADYSAAVRAELSDGQLLNVRNGDNVAADYIDTGELLAEAVALQVPGFESLADYGDELVEAERRASASGYRLSRVLVACEYSGTVRDAFRARGHDAVSCDILETDAPHGPHLLGDARDYLGDGWHMMVAHPPCTYLASCQLWRCKPEHDVPAKTGHPAGWREEQRQQALEFVRDLAAAPIERACIENPKGCIGTENAAPGFTPTMVQPYEFGHDHSKQTYLWLRGLPELERDPAQYVAPRITTNNNGSRVKRWANQCDGSGADRTGPSADRGHKRSAFFQGIADAMAEQWGGIAAALTTPAAQPAQLALF
jgi:hypothetical protein